jgi:hypothetical protein
MEAVISYFLDGRYLNTARQINIVARIDIKTPKYINPFLLK